MSELSNSELFKKLKAVDIKDNIEDKNGLNYLSWSYAIENITKTCPDFNYEPQMFPDKDGVKRPYIYDEKLGYMVATRVSINGMTKPMWLSVMDYNNFAMKDHPYQVKTKSRTFDVAPATMNDINKALMRCLVKNIAVFGLGISLYTNEDIDYERQKQSQERWEGLNEINNK